MKRLVKWHKQIFEDLQWFWGFSAYQLTWIAFGKGAVIGYLVGAYA